jgi:hypothetical protein
MKMDEEMMAKSNHPPDWYFIINEKIEDCRPDKRSIENVFDFKSLDGFTITNSVNLN